MPGTEDIEGIYSEVFRAKFGGEKIARTLVDDFPSAFSREDG
jgi:hypothetical protein